MNEILEAAKLLIASRRGSTQDGVDQVSASALRLLETAIEVEVARTGVSHSTQVMKIVCIMANDREIQACLTSPTNIDEDDIEAATRNAVRELMQAQPDVRVDASPVVSALMALGMQTTWVGTTLDLDAISEEIAEDLDQEDPDAPAP